MSSQGLVLPPSSVTSNAPAQTNVIDSMPASVDSGVSPEESTGPETGTMSSQVTPDPHAADVRVRHAGKGVNHGGSHVKGESSKPRSHAEHKAVQKDRAATFTRGGKDRLEDRSVSRTEKAKGN